jgi:hypothetical protein
VIPALAVDDDDDDKERYDADCARRRRYEVQARERLIERHSNSLHRLLPKYLVESTPDEGLVAVTGARAFIDQMSIADASSDEWAIDYQTAVVRWTQSCARKRPPSLPTEDKGDSNESTPQQSPVTLARLSVACELSARNVEWPSMSAVFMSMRVARSVQRRTFDDRDGICRLYHAMLESAARDAEARGGARRRVLGRTSSGLWPTSLYSQALTRLYRPSVHKATKIEETYSKTSLDDLAPPELKKRKTT